MLNQYPLSPMQQGMLFHSIYEPNAGFYIQQIICTLRERVDASALHLAWRQVVERHAVLRTSFRWEGVQEPLQEVQSAVEFGFEIEDWRDLDPEAQQQRLNEYLRKDRLRGFDLTKAPLMRIVLFQLAEHFHMLWTFHHSLLDGRSHFLVLSEVFRIYDAAKKHDQPKLQDSRPYSDYIEWLQKIEDPNIESFWRQLLSGFVAPTPVPGQDKLTTRFTPEERHSFRELRISESVTAKLKLLAEQNEVTLNNLVQGSWALLLSRYSGEEDVVFGTTRACRRSTVQGADSMVGLFINTVPFRVRVDPQRRLIDWLKELRSQHISLRSYEHTSLLKIQEWSEVPRGIPLFETVLIFENYQMDSRFQTLGDQWARREVKLAEQANYPLVLAAYAGSDLLLKLEYDTGCFDVPTVDRMLLRLKTVLEAMVLDPDQQIGKLSLLTESERQQVLVEWNQTTSYRIEKGVHQLFEEQVERTPNEVAIIYEAECLTYGELNRRANQLARHLKKLGVGPEILVGIYVQRSLEMVIGLLGVLKAGGAYVPLDPAFPRERLSFMMNDARISVLLTQRRLVDDFPPSDTSIVLMDANDSIAQGSDENLSEMTAVDNLAYLIYTSGSTGRPKGVQISHRALTNFLSAMERRLGLTSADVLLSVTTLSFDIAGLELYLPLISGARVAIVSRAVASDGIRLKESLDNSVVTMVQATPATWQMLVDAGWRGNEHLKVLCGGEALSRQLANALLARSAVLWNMYGPTETTIWSAACELESGEGVVTIGRPIANTQLYILDQNLNPVPIDFPGELYIGGEGLARGYFNDAALTAEKFLPNSFDDHPGARLYKTGDLARYLADGRIEYLGRTDNQVKLRGFRIELGEVEAVLTQAPEVSQAVAMVREVQPGDTRLVAYVVAADGGKVKGSDLRRFLQSKLPEYMVPSAILVIDALPLTPNGKINRQALPAPDLAGREIEQPFVAPRTPVEAKLAQIWADVLRKDTVGVLDNFFELGGHSLLAMLMISRVRDALGVDIQVHGLFEAPTIARFAEKVAALAPDSTSPRIVPVDRECELPLSFSQQRLWFLNELQGESALYNVPIALRLEGSLNVEALQKAFEALVSRHETLRTTFAAVGGKPRQQIEQKPRYAFSIYDLPTFDDVSDVEAEIQRIGEQEVRKGFDLKSGPLLRTKLLRISDTDHALFITMHHIVSDGWSMGILVRDLGAFYEQFISGKPAQIPELPAQYADYAVWQRQRLDGEALEKELSYWRKQLEGAPPLLELSVDRSRPSMRTFRGSQHSITLSESLTESVKALSRQEGVTDFMTLLAAFLALLASYANREDIVVGTDLANRTQSETEGLIGFFVNLLPLRVDLSGNPSFKQLLRRVREVALGAYAHQEVPFEKLVEELQPERSLSHNPLVQVLFVFQNTPVGESSFPGLSVEPIDMHTGTSKFDLALFVREADGKLLMTWVYNTDLFEAERLSGMARRYEILLSNLLAQPNDRLSSIDMLSETEKAEQKTKKDERHVSRLRNLMSARRQAVNLSETRGVKTEYLPDKTVPLVFQPEIDDVDLVDWARSNRDFIDKELLKHGALLFRRFDLRSPADFEKFAEAICPNLFAEYGDLPREGVGGKVYGSTPYPSDQAILFHNESSHMHRWPMRIWFFCVQPAEQGGETPIVDCRRVYQLINPKLRDRLAEKKLMYVRNYIDGLDVSWQTFFRTTDRSVVEDYCRRSSIEFEWNDDRLRTKQICPAVVKHPQTNEMVFFNQLQLHHVSCLEPAVRESLLSIVKEEDLPRNVYYGDGSPIEDSVIQEIREIYEQVAVSFPWQKGDVMMLNNMLIAHGRNPYVGARKIVVAMGEIVNKDELD